MLGLEVGIPDQDAGVLVCVVYILQLGLFLFQDAGAVVCVTTSMATGMS